MARITRFRVKYQEAGGIQLARLFSTDLAKGESCQREDCPHCSSKEEKKTGCKQQSTGCTKKNYHLMFLHRLYLSF